MIIPDLDIATPTTGVSNIVQQDPYGLSGAGEVLGVGADLTIKKEQRDADAYEIKTRPDFQMGLLNAIEESKMEAETPDQMTELYLEKSRSIYDDLYQNAPNQFAKRKLEEKFSQYQTAYGSQILQVQAQENQNLRILSVGQTIDKYTSQIGVNGNYDAHMAAIDQAITDAGAFTSPLEQEKLRLQANAQAKQVKLDYELSNNNFKEVTRLINDETFSEGLGVKEIQGYRDAITKTKDLLESKRYTDGAAYAEIMGATTTEEKVAIQGGDPATASVIPNDRAKQMVGQISTFRSEQDIFNLMEQLENEHGDYTPNAVNDLVKNGLPPQYKYMFNLAISDSTFDGKIENAEQIALSFKLARSREEGKSMVELAKNYLTVDGNMISRTSPDGFEAKFNNKFDDMARIYEKEGREDIAFIKEQTLSLAYASYSKNRDVDNAIDFAMKGLENGNQIIDDADEQYRVPTSVNKTLMLDGMDKALQTPVAVYNENKVLEQYLGDKVKEQGYWASNDTMTGLVLKSMKGEPLTYTDGRIVEYKYSELEKMGKKVREDLVARPSAMTGAVLFGLGEPEPKKPEPKKKPKIVIKDGRPMLPEFRNKGKSNTPILEEFIDGGE